ncbi:hypothetical protein C8R46DRAFT_1313313 [Mycena filopes]|nr:hypothetical protein C8R46DRAFT_1313313 [Mycena filopes]
MVVESTTTGSRDRRRSLKTLLHLPLFPHAPTSAQNPITSAGAAGLHISLPADILHEIVEELPPSDLLSVSLTKLAVRPNYHLAWPTRDVTMAEGQVVSEIA